LGIKKITDALKSHLNTWYLDDGTIGGDPLTVMADINVIANLSESHGLTLNHRKCEIISNSEESARTVCQAYPSMCSVHHDDGELLGSALGVTSSKRILEKHIERMKTLAFRLTFLHPHDAFYLLKNCFCIPKLLYFLRTTPSFSIVSELARFDEIVRHTLCEVLNIDLNSNQWIQASLPVQKGGIGIRRATMIAPSAYISSWTCTIKLGESILPQISTTQINTDLEQMVTLWTGLSGTDSPSLNLPLKQSSLDKSIADASFTHLLSQATSPIDSARLVACNSKHSGCWINAVPCSSWA
jgi:hypothetical protein